MKKQRCCKDLDSSCVLMCDPLTQCFLTRADKGGEADRKQMGIDLILAPLNVGSNLLNLGSGDNQSVEQRTDTSTELALLKDQTKQPESRQ